MKLIILMIAWLSILDARAQPDYIAEIAKWQEQLDSAFSNPESSPLSEKAIKNFKGLEYFPINSRLRIEARFVRTPDQLPFTMPTTTNRLPVYEKFGEVHFIFENQEMTLSLYQNHRLRETEEYGDYLFLPFTDLTNGFSTYDGGRYLDLKIPEGDTIILDFNKAYNPSCAYNATYSCPIPPRENDLQVEINVGVRGWNK